MSRLQVLYLPSVSDGDRHEPRFALVADDCDLPDPDRDALRTFASELGAQGCLVLSGTVDLLQGDDDADEELAQQLAGLLRVPAPPMPAPPAQEKKTLPPPNTIEGKMARVWGGNSPTDEDPR